ncbi:MAG TPA: hypothetical protein VFE37_01845 [Chloroflexota bacterium]|nr:hypothetical protein [Chloroflexota bacterium]
MRRWPGLARRVDRAWDKYDQLGEWQRVGLGLAVALVLAASLLYTLGAASLLALARYQPPPPTEVPVGSPTPTLLPIAPEVNPISPLLAERTPTARPSPTHTVTSGVGSDAGPSPTVSRPTASGPSPTVSRSAASGPSPTLGALPRAAATATRAPAGARVATATRTPIRPATPTATPTRLLR